MKRRTFVLAATFFIASSVINTVSAIDLDRLSDADILHVQSMLEKLKPFIDDRKTAGDANMLTFEEFYAQLEPHEADLMDQIRKIKPAPEERTKIDKSDFVALDGQVLQIPNPENPKYHFASIIERQYLPKNVQAAYERMMKAMEKDIKKRLYIESGYRSPAYQLYLFVFYLSNHNYSIKETNRWVALPGLSEHNRPEVQAIDFITLEGISGEHNAEDFDSLPEFKWLEQNAGNFGFILSYPKNNTSNSAYEPWHWHYEQNQDKSK